MRQKFTAKKNNLIQDKRPDKESPNYLCELLVFKDKVYRLKSGKPRIFSDDPIEYSSSLIDSVQKIDLVKIKGGLKCPKCGQMGAFKTAEQKRCGDEGQSMVLKCPNKSCGFSKLLSH